MQCGRDQVEDADGDEGEAGPLGQHRLGCPRRPPLPAHIQVYLLSDGVKSFIAVNFLKYIFSCAATL